MADIFDAFEHFNVIRQNEALARTASILEDHGRLVISVPIESELPPIVKTKVRRVNHQKNFKTLRKP